MRRSYTAPFSWLLLLSFSAGLFAGTEGDAFDLPYSQIERYQPDFYSETVEAMTMTRIRLSGRRDLIYDLVDFMQWHQEYQFASVAFYHRIDPRMRYEVTSLPANRLPMKFGVELLESYLRGREAALAEFDYELLLAPEVSTGPARFRILGQRALPIMYSFVRGDDRIIRGENWVEINGTVHIVAVEAHNETVFRSFSERVRLAMNSMRYYSEN